MKKIYLLGAFSLLFLNNCGLKTNNLAFLKKINSNLGQIEDIENNDIDSILNLPVKTMTLNQVIIAKAYYETAQDIDMTIKCDERLISIGTDQETMRRTILQLARLYLNQSDFEKSEKHALDYQTLYPGSKEAKDAGYIAIMANYLGTYSAHRDQKRTEKALELAQDFLKKYGDDKQYSAEIKEIIDSCYDKILESEINIVNTYLTRYDYYQNLAALNAVKRRVGYIKEKLLPNLKAGSDRFNDLELKLAQIDQSDLNKVTVTA